MSWQAVRVFRQQIDKMILITGATGRIGRRVVNRLVAANQPVRVLVRDHEKARNLLPSKKIDTVVGDLADHDLLHSALDGTQAVMLLSPVDPEQVELQGKVVTAALATSQPYIVKISGLGTSLDSYIDSGRWHAETEQQIQSSGLRHTFLRPLFFMQNLVFLLGSAGSEGVIRAGVADSKIAMVDADDIADVTTRLLIEKNIAVNENMTLTSHESVTYHQVAEAMTQALGREVKYQQQTLKEVNQALLKSRQPEWHIKILIQFNRAFLEGMGDVVSDAVADILGRPAVTLQEYLEREVRESTGDHSSNPFPS